VWGVEPAPSSRGDGKMHVSNILEVPAILSIDVVGATVCLVMPSPKKTS
jgi:hypothetical protein